MLLVAGALYGLGASSAFDLARIRVEGAGLTDPAVVERALDDVRGSNLFRLQTAPLAGRLLELPTVADARVGVALPDALTVALVERTPILVWSTDERRLLSDAEGYLFAEITDASPERARTIATELPVVDDRRVGGRLLSVGSRLDPVDLDAATRLASLVPSDVGSVAPGLEVRVTDEFGFVLSPGGPDAWTAVFGFYTTTLRRTDIIPGQVRLLRSLLAGREETIERVVLASEDDGTFTERRTPEPTDEPESDG